MAPSTPAFGWATATSVLVAGALILTLTARHSSPRTNLQKRCAGPPSHINTQTHAIASGALTARRDPPAHLAHPPREPRRACVRSLQLTRRPASRWQEASDAPLRHLSGACVSRRRVRLGGGHECNQQHSSHHGGAGERRRQLGRQHLDGLLLLFRLT